MKIFSFKYLLWLAIITFGITCRAGAQSKNPENQSLTREQQSIVPIAAYTSNGNQVDLKGALNEGLDAGLTVNEVKEIIVHLYAYAGFPRSLNALSTLTSVLEERRQKGIEDVVGKEASPLPAGKTKEELGSKVLAQLVGTSEASGVRKSTPIIDTFLKEHLFGAIFGRDVLDYQAREIVTISALASLAGTESQLASHLRVGKKVGLTDDQLQEIGSELSVEVGWQEGLKVVSKLNEMGGLKSETTQTLKNELSVEKANVPTIKSSQVDTESVNADPTFPKGTRIANENFTGTAWVHMMVNSDSTFNTSVGNVTFEPGARTNWHYHPGGQVLLVTSGKGRYQEEGKAVRELRTGDVITCEPNIPHWHGAAPGSEFSHVAIGTNTGKGSVVWLKPVTDEEYNRQ